MYLIQKHNSTYSPKTRQPVVPHTFVISHKNLLFTVGQYFSRAHQIKASLCACTKAPFIFSKPST